MKISRPRSFLSCLQGASAGTSQLHRCTSPSQKGDIIQISGISVGIVLDHSPPNNIHYISWTSGIIITLFLTSLFFLIPQHNPLLEPFYWFEFPICIATGWMLIFTIAIMFECAYFANITYAKNLKSFCILYAQAAGFYTVLTSIYYLVYTFGLDLYGPLPFAMYIGRGGGTILT